MALTAKDSLKLVHTAGSWYCVCMHTVGDIIASMDQMDSSELARLQEALDQKRQHVNASSVVERRDHLNGILQLEYRANPKTGTHRGPYWYFHYRENGRQRTLYIGKTDDPKGKLAGRE